MGGACQERNNATRKRLFAEYFRIRFHRKQDAPCVHLLKIIFLTPFEPEVVCLLLISLMRLALREPA